MWRKGLKRQALLSSTGRRPKSLTSPRRCGLIRSFRGGCHFYRGTPAKMRRNSGFFSVRPDRPQRLAALPQDAAGLMQLSADNLACVRGGREVFRGLSFNLQGGEALLVTGRNGAGKSSLLRIIAGLLRLSAGRLDLAGGDAEATHRRAGPLPRPPGRAEAVADGRGKPRLLGRISRRQRGRPSRRLWRRSSCRRSPICRRPISPPGNAGGCRLPGWSR